MKPPMSKGLRFAAVTFAGDSGKIRAVVSKSGIAAQERGGRLVIHAHGAMLGFEMNAAG
jgi:hypothetical protein